MAKITFTNPIAYSKRAMCDDVDACNCVGVANVALTNGTLVTLGGMNTGEAEGMGYVFEVTPTTANTAVDVWMVVAPAVPMDIRDNMFIDPRAFSVEAGRPVDLVRPMAGTDYFQVSAEAFGSNQKPDVTTNKYVEAAANGQMKAVSTASGVTGIVFQCVAVEPIPVGYEMVDGYVLKCVQNPNVTLS